MDLAILPIKTQEIAPKSASYEDIHHA